MEVSRRMTTDIEQVKDIDATIASEVRRIADNSDSVWKPQAEHFTQEFADTFALGYLSQDVRVANLLYALKGNTYFLGLQRASDLCRQIPDVTRHTTCFKVALPLEASGDLYTMCTTTFCWYVHMGSLDKRTIDKPLPYHHRYPALNRARLWALSYLMPAPLFRKEWNKHTNPNATLPTLAEFFQCHVGHVKLRATGLGLTNTNIPELVDVTE